MALSYAHGAVQWLAADAATTTYVVTGLGFQPKALKFTANGLASATDAASTTTHIRRSCGFAASTTDRRCVAAQDQDAAADMLCTAAVRDDAVVATVTSTGPAVDGLLDLSAIGADGFTLIVDDQSPVNITVFWEAWGGTDITDVSTLEIAEPAATGSVTYTVSAFQANNGGHQIVMFAGSQQTGATPSVSRASSGMCLGWAAGLTTNNVVAYVGGIDNTASAETSRYSQTGECLALGPAATSGADNPTARAALTAWTDGGFTLNWIARANTGRKYIGLAIKGGSWAGGNTTLARGTLNATGAVSGLTFTPVGLETMYISFTVLTAGTGAAGDYLSYGMGTSTTSRRCWSTWSEDSVVTSAIDVALEYDQISNLTFSGATDSTFDISAMAADGFTLIVDDASAFAATVWVGYLTFGSGTSTPPESSGGAGGPATRLRLHRKALGF